MLNFQITASCLLTPQNKAISLLKSTQDTSQLGWAFKVLELPMCFIRSACQIVEQLWKPPPYLYDIRIGRVASHNFCNFPKSTTTTIHIHSKQRLARRVEVRKYAVWTSLSNSLLLFFTQLFLSLVMCTTEYNAMHVLQRLCTVNPYSNS